MSTATPAQELWKARLRDARERANRQQKELTDALRVTVSPISRFENGDPGTVQQWFRDGKAETYAREVGLPFAKLKGWHAEATGAALPPAPWHEAFPGVSAEAVFIEPRLRWSQQRGTLQGPISLTAFAERLTPRPSDAGTAPHVELVGVAAGVDTLAARLEALGARVSRRQEPAPYFLKEPSEPDFVVFAAGWGAEELEALIAVLVSLLELTDQAAARARRLVATLRAVDLTLGPDTAIRMLARCREGAASAELPFELELAEALWGRVRSKRPDWSTLPSAMLVGFWRLRRLGCQGTQWTRPTREAAFATMNEVLQELAGGPLSRAEAERLAEVVASGGKRDREALLARLRLPSAEEVIDAMIEAELLRADGQRLVGPDPATADALAGLGLRTDLDRILRDPRAAWATDPSWLPVLRWLARAPIDRRPLLQGWRALPAWAQAPGVVACLEVLRSGPEAQGPAVSSKAVEEVVHAALDEWLKTLNLKDGRAGIGEARRAPLGRALRAVGEAWGDRLPLQPWPTETEETVRIRTLMVLPWSFVPETAAQVADWMRAAEEAPSEGVPSLPSLAERLTFAATGGHKGAIGILSGDAMGPDGPRQDEVRSTWPPNPRDPDFRARLDTGAAWSSLPLPVRCDWLAQASAHRETLPLRFAALIRDSTPTDQPRLRTVAASLGADVVREALAELPRLARWGGAPTRHIEGMWSYNPEGLRRLLDLAVHARSWEAVDDVCSVAEERVVYAVDEGFDGALGATTGATLHERVEALARYVRAWVALAVDAAWELAKARKPSRLRAMAFGAWPLGLDEQHERAFQGSLELHAVLERLRPGARDALSVLELLAQADSASAWRELAASDALPALADRLRTLDETLLERSHLETITLNAAHAERALFARRRFFQPEAVQAAWTHLVGLDCWLSQRPRRSSSSLPVPLRYAVEGLARRGLPDPTNPPRQPPHRLFDFVQILREEVTVRCINLLIDVQDPELLTLAEADAAGRLRRSLTERMNSDAPLREWVWRASKDPDLRDKAVWAADRADDPAPWVLQAWQAWRARPLPQDAPSVTPWEELFEALRPGRSGAIGRLDTRGILDVWERVDLAALDVRAGELDHFAAACLAGAAARVTKGETPLLRLIVDVYEELTRRQLLRAPVAQPASISTMSVRDKRPNAVHRVLGWAAGVGGEPTFAALRALADQARDVVVDAPLFELAYHDSLWADDEDHAAPVTERDLHVYWFEQVFGRVSDHDPDVMSPGLPRVAARAHLARHEPERVAPWLFGRFQPLPAPPPRSWTELWPLWAALQADEAWAWLTERHIADPSFERSEGPVPIEWVRLVEETVPDARPWWLERAWARRAQASTPPGD